MISAPLISALEKDEDFLHRVMRSAENDPNLRLECVELSRSCDGSNSSKNSTTRIYLRGYSPHHHKTFHRSLIIKRQTERLLRRHLQSDPAFLNEAAVYGCVIPTLRHMFSSDASLLPFAHSLYVSGSVIVLQDLTPDGYKSVNRLQGLDLQHSKITMKALGRFHACSLAMKHNDKQQFHRMKSQIREVIFVPESMPVFSPSLENSLRMAVSSLKMSSGPGQVVVDDAAHKLQTLRGRTFYTLQSLVSPKEPMSVICHGDFWINNLVFHYTRSDENCVDDVKFIDVQVARYSSLAIDILHFLYTSLQPNILRDYYDDLLNEYYVSLSKTLQQLAPSAPTVSQEDIQNEIETHALYGLLMGFLLLPAITATEDINKVLAIQNNIGVKLTNNGTFTPHYIQRVRDIVLEFVDRGFI